jgi:YHS domain-containing protein
MNTKILKAAALCAVVFSGFALQADDAKTTKAEKAKPYKLEKCIVSDEKFEGSDMKPFEFVRDGQTYKLCCKNCLKDFDKDPKKYVAKLAKETKAAEAKKKSL